MVDDISIRPALYLDQATTSHLKAPGVVDAMTEAMLEIGASPARSQHRFAKKADRLVTDVRRSVAEIFALDTPEGVIFTPGATFALNTAIRGLLKPGDHTVTTAYEHNSVLRPLSRMVAVGCGVAIARADVPHVSLVEAVERELRPETRLVVISHTSNVTGAILPWEKIGRLAQERGIAVLLDAAQAVGHLPVDLRTAPVDMIAFSAHKALLGPPGVGCLLVKNRSLDFEPLTVGGDGHQSDKGTPPPVFPSSYESGTPNLPAIAGLGAALRFVDSDEHLHSNQRAADQRRRLLLELAQFDHVKVHGVHSQLSYVPIVSLTVHGWAPHGAAAHLDHVYGIQTRSGLHCAPLMHEQLGTRPEGTIRISLGWGNPTGTVERVVNALRTMG